MRSQFCHPSVKARALSVACAMLATAPAFAQSDPSPQSLSYAQDFSGLPHSSSAYPEGWQGWGLIASSPTTFRQNSPASDVSLVVGSSAGTTVEGVHNYDGKLGLLRSDGLNPAVAVALNTLGSSGIKISFDIMTIRNPFDGGSNTRTSQVDLQYRVGTHGNFDSVSGNPNGVYQNNPGPTKIADGDITGQKIQNVTLALPAACDNESVVELRWVQRDAGGSGSRPSFAVDNIQLCTTPAISCPNNITVTNNSCQCAANVAFTVTASGSPAPIIEFKIGPTVITSPYPFPVGTTIVNCTASNVCGTATCSFTVTVQNAQALSLTCFGNKTNECGAGPLDFDMPLASVTCGSVSVTIVNTTTNARCGKTFVATRTWSGTDACGNTAQCSQTIVTRDTTTPVLTDCPQNISVCQGDPITFIPPTATDTCSATGTVTVVGTRSDGLPLTNALPYLPYGTTTVTYTATDECTNRASCSFTITVYPCAGGGVLTLVASQGVGQQAYVQVHINPVSAINWGAGWACLNCAGGDTSFYSLSNHTASVSSGQTAFIFFKCIDVWVRPTNRTVNLVLGQTTIITNSFYTLTPPPSPPTLVISPNKNIGITGAGGPYRIYYCTNLSSGAWWPPERFGTLGFQGFPPWLTNAPSAYFRAVWSPDNCER